jgi:hypothetical protein
MRPFARLAVILAVGGLVIPGAAARACATDHVPLRWAGFPPPISDFGPVYLYWAEEPVTGDTSVELTIRANAEGSCPMPNRFATAQYAVDTPPGTTRPATPGADYDPIFTRNTGPLWDHRGSPNEHSFPVTIHSDLLIETAAEQARARITATDGKPEVPQDVPLWIIDSDGLARTALESAGPYPQEERFRDVMVPVFRAGDAAQPLSVDYSLAGSSDAPATPGVDISVTSPQPLEFAANERVKLITLSLRADGVPEPTEEATVTLTGTGVDPNDPRSATIQIIDSAGGVALPTSTLHHPRQGLRYPADDFRLREIHIFTERGGGGSVARAEFAIRMNKKNGSCAWLEGKRFRPGGCEEHRWMASDGQYEPDFFYIRMRQLAPSVRKIRTYTAFTRAIDTSRNVEVDMARGRNANTFEVRRPKKRTAAGR